MRYAGVVLLLAGLVAACGPRALPPLRPVAPCDAALQADTGAWPRQPLVPGGRDGYWLRLSPAYAPHDSSWVAPGRGMFRAFSRPAPPVPDTTTVANIVACAATFAGAPGWVATWARYGDFGPEFAVWAAWPAGPNRWVFFFGMGLDATAQAELLASLHTVSAE